MPKNWTILSLSPREWLAHFARIAENWSAEDLLLTPPASQFRDRPGSHPRLEFGRIELRGPYCKRDDAWGGRCRKADAENHCGGKRNLGLAEHFRISWLSFAAYPQE